MLLPTGLEPALAEFLKLMELQRRREEMLRQMNLGIQSQLGSVLSTATFSGQLFGTTPFVQMVMTQQLTGVLSPNPKPDEETRMALAQQLDHPSSVWIQRNGNPIPIADMTPTHLFRTIKMLGRNSAATVAGTKTAMWLRIMEDELIRRKELELAPECE